MKIALLALPFLLPKYPSLGLTQIKGRLMDVFKGEVEVRLFYLNHDFYRYLGRDLYSMIDSHATYTLLNDWLFRHEAFDHVTPNHKEYWERFYPHMPFSDDDRKKLSNPGHFINRAVREYRLESYDVIGINANFSVVPGLAFCRHLKKINREIITVIGGAGVYREMGRALCKYFPYVDYVCSGSGLISFPQLIDRIIKNDETGRNAIDGMFSGDNTGKVGIVGESLDINENIALDYHDFLESFKKFGLDKEMKPIILLETSRGCYWNKCKFCGLNEDQLRYRVKETDTAIEEINRYLKEYDCDIHMVDNVMPRHYIKKVLPHLHVPGGRFLVYEVRADYTEEEMRLLKQANVKNIQPGIESLSTAVHDVMNKGVNAFQCINMLKLCVKYGIIPGWNLIIGFPHMTGEMYERLLSLIPSLYHLFPPEVLTPVRFDRYSEYWMEKEKYHLDISPFSAYEFIYPYDHEFLSDFAYYFEEKDVTSDRIFLMSEYYLEYETAINKWKKLWQTDKIDKIPKLTCFLKGGVPYIYDSRQGTIKEFAISPLWEKVLTVLGHPMSIDSIMTDFPAENRERIVHVLHDLESKDLLFKENDRYMSLVIRDYSDGAMEVILENRD
jgi:ribosomal peptide maturation radical SAM protein 1